MLIQPLDEFYSRTIRKCLELIYGMRVMIMEFNDGFTYFVRVDEDQNVAVIAPVNQWHELIYSKEFLTGLVGEGHDELTDLPYWKSEKVRMSEYNHPVDYLFNIIDSLNQF